MTEVYNVHMYYVMRAKFCGIEADSHEQAIALVRDLPISEAVETENADEITGWLVDVPKDESYQNSKAYQPDGVTLEGLRWFHIHFDDDDGDNFDLLVHTYDTGDAFKLWQEYYGEDFDDVGFEDVAIEEKRVPAGRGVIPW